MMQEIVTSPSLKRVASASVQTRLCIVVPCYNEQEVLPETIKRLCAFLDRLAAIGKIAADSHVIFVDDGSRDQTWHIIRQHHEQDSRVRGLKLSANRGHQTALIAGLVAADGDAIASIDADLQDDISAMEAMVEAYGSGCDVVYGIRKRRATDSMFKRSTAETY
jgi:glycosyltransferase involved in cell wall biosynthesis